VTTRAVPSNKVVVETYIDGFRRGDHATILSCLADDVVWVLHGYRTLSGKEAFDAEIENEAAVGRPVLNLERLVEEGDTVVAIGSGEMTLRDAGPVAFVFSEVFTFADGRIARLETFHINVGGAGGTGGAGGAGDNLWSSPTT
jgi:ketosteroid isomerase-like protein